MCNKQQKHVFGHNFISSLLLIGYFSTKCIWFMSNTLLIYLYWHYSEILESDYMKNWYYDFFYICDSIHLYFIHKCLRCRYDMCSSDKKIKLRLDVWSIPVEKCSAVIACIQLPMHLFWLDSMLSNYYLGRDCTCTSTFFF